MSGSGSGNVDPVTGTFLSNVDERFPRLTQPAFDGLSLAPGASATLSFSIKVPASAEKTNYLANSCSDAVQLARYRHLSRPKCLRGAGHLNAMPAHM